MPQGSGASDSKEDWEAMCDGAIIEEAPSHDRAPCFAAWEGPKPFPYGLTPEDLEEIEEGEDVVNPQRPLYGTQIYDTTPGAGDPEHVRRMALTLHKLTYRFGTSPSGSRGRNYWDPCFVDRIDVFGLPMPEGTKTRERVDRCIAHSKREIVHRILTFGADWYIPPSTDTLSYKRVLYIIDRDQARWGDMEKGEEGEEGGPFITAEWAFTRGWNIFPGEHDMPGAPPVGYGVSAVEKIPAMRFYRFEDVLEEFGDHIFAESTKGFNGGYISGVCTCDGEEDAPCDGNDCGGSLAHDVKLYARLLRAGKGRELLGEFEFQVDTMDDAKDGAESSLEIRTAKKEE